MRIFPPIPPTPCLILIFFADVDAGAKSGKWVLFILPLITVLREGMEAVIFVGGVSLGQPATSIPLAAIVGLVCGLICGFLIYSFASRTSEFLCNFSALRSILTLCTSAHRLPGVHDELHPSHRRRSLQPRDRLLPGAALQHPVRPLPSPSLRTRLTCDDSLGADVDDAGAAGDGPGSYDVRGNVWHLDCCNPENNFDSDGWTMFNAIFGWTNSATIGTVLGYVFYWLAAMVVLVFMKYKEVRRAVSLLCCVVPRLTWARLGTDEGVWVRERGRRAPSRARCAAPWRLRDELGLGRKGIDVHSLRLSRSSPTTPHSCSRAALRLCILLSVCFVAFFGESKMFV